eukprot:9585688-Alexandrium_andersonii.AAC.1
MRRNERRASSDPRRRKHEPLAGHLPSGENRVARVAARPSALRAAILRGVAAQHACEGRAAPRGLQKQLGEGRE